MACPPKYTSVAYFGNVEIGVEGKVSYSGTYSDIFPPMYLQSFRANDNLSYLRIPYYRDFPAEWKAYQLDDFNGGTLTLNGLCYSKSNIPLFKVNSGFAYYAIRIVPVIDDYTPAETLTANFYLGKCVQASMKQTKYNGVVIYTGSITYLYAERSEEPLLAFKP